MNDEIISETISDETASDETTDDALKYPFNQLTITEASTYETMAYRVRGRCGICYEPVNGNGLSEVQALSKLRKHFRNHAKVKHSKGK